MVRAKIKICTTKVFVFFLLSLLLQSASAQDIPFLPVSIRWPPSIPKDYSIVKTIIYPTPNAFQNQNNQSISSQSYSVKKFSAPFQQNAAQQDREDSKKDGSDLQIPWKNTEQQLIRDYIIDDEGREVELTPTRQKTRQKGSPLPKEPIQNPKNLHSSFNPFPTLSQKNRRPIPPFAKGQHEGKNINYQKLGNYIIVLLMIIVTFITFIALCTRSPQEQGQHLQRKYRTGRQSIPQSQQEQQNQQQQDQILQSSIIIIKNRQRALH